MKKKREFWGRVDGGRLSGVYSFKKGGLGFLKQQWMCVVVFKVPAFKISLVAYAQSPSTCTVVNILLRPIFLLLKYEEQTAYASDDRRLTHPFFLSMITVVPRIIFLFCENYNVFLFAFPQAMSSPALRPHNVGGKGYLWKMSCLRPAPPTRSFIGVDDKKKKGSSNYLHFPNQITVITHNV